MTTRFLIGTSGWNYARWRRRFYPPRLPSDAWLAYYARHFPTVEVNYTFYRLPAATVFSAWRRVVPPSFTFAVKASRFITHIKRVREARRYVRLLLARARPLAAMFRPILFQLPPTMRFDRARLEKFLAGLPPGRRYAMEFRHESWHRDETYALWRTVSAMRGTGRFTFCARPHLSTFVFTAPGAAAGTATQACDGGRTAFGP